MSDKIKLEIITKPDYLHFRFRGMLNLGDEDTFVKLMGDALTGEEELPVLVDIRELKNDISVFSNFLLIQNLAQTNLIKIGRIAVLASISESKLMEYAELSSRSFGLKNRFFFDEDDALSWLIVGSEKPV